MKKILSILCLLGIMLTSCSSSDPNENVVKAKKSNMTVCVTPTLDCFPLYVAVETGLDEEMGFPIELQVHKSKADCDTAIIAGSAQAILTDDAHASNIKDNWMELNRKYIQGIIEKEKKILAEKKQQRKAGKKKKDKKDKDKPDYAKRTKEWMKKAGSDSLFVLPHDNLHFYLFTNRKNRVNEAKQLADRIIAVDRQGTDAVMAQMVLDSVKLTDEKAFLVQVQKYDVRMKMLLVNAMDACVLPEPHATAVRKTGHRSICSGSTVKGRKAGCLLVKGNAEKLRKLYNRACDSINKNGIHHYDSVLQRRYTVPVPTIQYIPAHKFRKI